MKTFIPYTDGSSDLTAIVNLNYNSILMRLSGFTAMLYLPDNLFTPSAPGVRGLAVSASGNEGVFAAFIIATSVHVVTDVVVEPTTIDAFNIVISVKTTDRGIKIYYLDRNTGVVKTVGFSVTELVTGTVAIPASPNNTLSPQIKTPAGYRVNNLPSAVRTASLTLNNDPVILTMITPTCSYYYLTFSLLNKSGQATIITLGINGKEFTFTAPVGKTMLIENLVIASDSTVTFKGEGTLRVSATEMST